MNSLSQFKICSVSCLAIALQGCFSSSSSTFSALPSKSSGQAICSIGGYGQSDSTVLGKSNGLKGKLILAGDEAFEKENGVLKRNAQGHRMLRSGYEGFAHSLDAYHSMKDETFRKIFKNASVNQLPADVLAMDQVHAGARDVFNSAIYVSELNVLNVDASIDDPTSFPISFKDGFSYVNSSTGALEVIKDSSGEPLTDFFSLSLEGKIDISDRPDLADQYEFMVVADDGVRLFLDDQLWIDEPLRSNSRPHCYNTPYGLHVGQDNITFNSKPNYKAEKFPWRQWANRFYGPLFGISAAELALNNDQKNISAIKKASNDALAIRVPALSANKGFKAISKNSPVKIRLDYYQGRGPGLAIGLYWRKKSDADIFAQSPDAIDMATVCSNPVGLLLTIPEVSGTIEEATGFKPVPAEVLKLPNGESNPCAG